MSSHRTGDEVSRRRMLKMAAAGAGTLGLVGAIYEMVSSPASHDATTGTQAGPLSTGSATPSGSGSASPSVSGSATGSSSASATRSPSTSAPTSVNSSSPSSAGAYQGLLHSDADVERMASNVRSGAQPWQAGWNRLVANGHSQATWKPRATATIVRGGSTGQNYTLLYNDVHAAYQNALRWRISGDTAHGDTARDILNAWSATLKTVTGDADRFLAAGIYGYQFANAAALMRGYPGFDLARFQKMMLTIFYPMNNDFLTHHNGACITNYWANWDLCSTASVLAIGILCEDPAKINQAVDYFKNGAGNGAIANAVPFLHPGGMGQWQESGRDQGHTMLGIGLAGAICEMAWNQGTDLYGYDNSRFLAGCEYVAAYNLGQEVPFTTYSWRNGDRCASQTQTVISAGSRGQNRPVWGLVYNHYVKRLGMSAPNVTAYAARVQPEGGGGDYGGDSGGYDQLGFGTLTFTL